MVAAIGCYWTVNVVVAGSVRSMTWPPVFVYILIGVAVADYAVAWWWDRWTVGQAAGQATPTALQRLTDQEKLALQARLQASAVGTLAFLEAPAIYGLVNSFGVSPCPRLFEWLAAASLLGFVLFRLQRLPVIFGLLDRLE